MKKKTKKEIRSRPELNWGLLVDNQRSLPLDYATIIFYFFNKKKNTNHG